jgi:DNA-directed RNA polymerase specialized sigma24 family protein
MCACRIHALAVPPAERPALSERAKAGDLDARDRLALSVWPMLNQKAARFARGRLARLAGLTADDLAAEAFAAMLRRLDKWQPARGSFTTWAGLEARTAFGVAAGARVGRNGAYTRHDIGRPLGQSADWLVAPPAGSAEPIRAAAVRAALGRLAPADRELIERHFFEGERIRDIAGAGGRPRGQFDRAAWAACGSRIRSALRALRRELAASADS